MNMRSLFAILFFLMTASSVTTIAATGQAMNVQKLFAQANAAYSRGDFNTAIKDYRRIEQTHGFSASLLYNLGNALAATGDTGRAVLNYERALRLTPSDQDISHNLRLVRHHAGLYQGNQPLYRRIAGFLKADQWAFIAGTCFALLALSLLLPQLSDRIPAGPAKITALVCFFILTLSLPATLYTYRDWNDGVVLNDRTRLLISPFASAASSGTIQAGRLVHPNKRYGDYLLVTDETGRSGWIHRSDLALIAQPDY